MKRTRVGVDVGGTFTDLVAVTDGKLLLAKVPSTANQADGVLEVLEHAGVDPATVAHLSHGTTVATNALLERRGARVGLVTTGGFRDVLEIGRQARPSLYDLTRDRPPALIPRELRFTVRERMGPGGVLAPLCEEDILAAAERLREERVDAVAVCFLFSFLHPAHERRAGDLLREALPGVHLALSSEVLPEFREFERFSTTAADAYLTPRLGAYLRSLAGLLERRGFEAPLIMQSSGGVARLEAVAGHAAACVLSGPAGGVVGAAYAARASGFDDVLTFDMGGTSTDVAPVIGGQVQTSTESVVAGIPIKLPMVDVHSVSAGGGSIAWADDGGALRVGPHSAGADPGPACYGNGGTEPTVTDADCLLGCLADGARLGRSVTLDRRLAEQALERLGRRLAMSALEVAAGVVAVADAEMVRALRVISVKRGLDPRELALVAFGGAGGMHACHLAEELGMTRILVPRACGVLSALGLAISDLRRDDVRPFPGVLGQLDDRRLVDAFEQLEALAAKEAPGEPTFERRADCRYHGQSFELTVPAEPIGAMAARFHAAHEARHGHRMDGEPVEVVSLRLVATVPAERPALEEPEPPPQRPERSRREVYLDDSWREIEIVPRASLGVGEHIEGPAIVDFPEATLLIKSSWTGTLDARGTVVLELRDPADA